MEACGTAVAGTVHGRGRRELTRDKTRKPGKKPLPATTVQNVVDLALGPPPGDATHWTGRMLAKAAGVRTAAAPARSLDSGSDNWASFGERRAQRNQTRGTALPPRCRTCPAEIARMPVLQLCDDARPHMAAVASFSRIPQLSVPHMRRSPAEAKPAAIRGSSSPASA